MTATVVTTSAALSTKNISSDGKQVHLYGGAAAMRSDVMPLRDSLSELFAALFFSFAFTFALAGPFAKAFG